MEYSNLGRSGLRMSTLTTATTSRGGGGGVERIGSTDVEQAARQLDRCRDHGGRLVDTADMYSAGRSEQLVGEALGASRDDSLVATKVRFPMGSGPTDAGSSRHHVIRGAEGSLRRLGTDRVLLEPHL